MAYRSRFKNKKADDLFEAIMLLDGLDECYRFFEDLCTVNEIHAMSQRWQVAKLLIDTGIGGKTALSIVNRLELLSKTVQVISITHLA